MPAPAVTKLQPDRQDTVGRRISSALLAVVVGGVAGMLGTLLHLHVAWIQGVPVPWGALAGLLLVGGAQMWATLTLNKIWVGGLTLIVSFTIVVLLAFTAGDDRFSIPITEQTWQIMPVLVVAELVWVLGVPLLGIVSLLICGRLLNRPSVKRNASTSGT